MKIGLFGYGKMGKMIEGIATDRGHEITAKIDVGNQGKVDFDQFDIAIDFSVPEAAASNILEALEHETPVVSGTTGWLDRYTEVTARCQELEGAFLYASNFSLGVNLFFALNEQLAHMMKSQKQYNVSIDEIHHSQKKDAPSGTAISIAEGIIQETDYLDWELGKGKEDVIPIHSKREGDYAGTHIVNYNGPVDQIRIQHTAHSRQGFAEGAVVAAEWLLNKKGVFSMKDVLNLG